MKNMLPFPLLMVVLLLLNGCSSIEKANVNAFPRDDTLNGNVYFENKVYTLEKPEIPSEYLGNALNDAVVLINEEEEYERKYWRVYRISNIISSCAIALLNNNDGKYYLCINLEYKPQDFGTWINDLHLGENLTCNSITLHSSTTKIDVSSENFVQLLLGLASDLQNHELPDPLSELHKSDEHILLSVNVERLGIKDHSILIYSNGYLVTNLTYNQQCFYIGEGSYKLLRNCLQ